MEHLREKGFFYADQFDMQREFQQAEAYFKQYPNEVKNSSRTMEEIIFYQSYQIFLFKFWQANYCFGNQSK